MTEVLNNIPFKFDADNIMKVMRVRRANSLTGQVVREIAGQISSIARPKAAYTMSWVENKGEDSVQIDGVSFVSKVLRKNLDAVERVFPYVATCGTEVESLAFPGDAMKAYWLDAIKMTLVGMASAYLTDHLKKRFALGQTAHMNPGSLADWPLTQQRKLFSLLGDVEKLIGVRLTESSVMYPLKSVSGIIFPTEVRFESCQLCPREKCPGRRMAYSSEMAREYLGK
jgi:hypothetical protein